MTHILGTILIWLLALALVACFPLTEFARGMATNPDAFKPSRGAMILSAVGTALIILMLAGCSTPPVETRIQRELVPIATKPLKPEQVPTVPAPLPRRPASLSAASDLLLGRWCEAVAYMLKADPLLRLSAGQAPAALPGYPECERH